MTTGQAIAISILEIMGFTIMVICVRSEVKKLYKKIASFHKELEWIRLISCMRKRKGCRLPIDDMVSEDLTDIAMKELWYQVENGEQEMPPEFIDKMMEHKGDLLSNSEPCDDCGDGCDKCNQAEDEQNDIEAKEEVEEEKIALYNEVTEANKEAADSAEGEITVRCHFCLRDTNKNFSIKDGLPFCSAQCEEQYLAEEQAKAVDQDSNHEIAADKINATTKNALKKSIKGGDEHEIESKT